MLYVGCECAGFGFGLVRYFNEGAFGYSKLHSCLVIKAFEFVNLGL